MTTAKQVKREQQMVAMLQSGQNVEEAFRWLVGEYQERLYWHIRRIVIEHEDANDVVQNTFVRVFRSIKNYKGDAKLYTWLYRIATNESITFLNSKKRKATTSLHAPENNLEQRLTTDAYFDGDDIQIKLQLALEKLPEKQRLVFNMRYFDNMPYQDISNVLGTSVGGLKASYHHAVKKIENYFKNG